MKIQQLPLGPNQSPEASPVYFRSLTLENVKCFKGEHTINFCNESGMPARWTVIVGENGVGKTTVLQALAGLTARPEFTEKFNGVTPAMADGAWIPWHITVHSKGSSSSHSLRARLAMGGTFSQPTFREDEGPPWGLTFAREGNDGKITVSQIGGRPEDLGALRAYGYGAGRRMSGRRRTISDPDPRRQNLTLFSDAVALPNAEEWLLELDHAARVEGSEHSGSARKIKDVVNLLKGVLPHISQINVTAVTQFGESRVELQFETPYGVVGLEQLSFGYQTVTAWVVDLARQLFTRYPTSDNAATEPAIVLIDEIDLHLHPKWQTGIMEHLSKAFPNTQFIVTAHSPLVVQAAVDAKVILLARDGDSVKVHDNLDMVRNWRIDQILTSDLFNLPTAMPRRQAELIEQRTLLLSKPNLTAEDKIRLEHINRALAESGESQIESDAERIIQAAAARLRHTVE